MAQIRLLRTTGRANLGSAGGFQLETSCIEWNIRASREERQGVKDPFES